MRAGWRRLGCGLALLLGVASAAEPAWDQAAAKKLVATVLEVEEEKSRPWNRIAWRGNVEAAVSEAKREGRALLVFFYVEQLGPPAERCCLEGRLLRTHVLGNPAVTALIKSNFIPVNVPLQKGGKFPLDWPALRRWATTFEFSNGSGFTGCSVVSPDLEVEYGNSGSGRISELFGSAAYDSGKFAAMLERAEGRLSEERALRLQRGISEAERAEELERFRRGITHAVRSEWGASLPPKGYALELALELYRMAGVADPVAVGKE